MDLRNKNTSIYALRDTKATLFDTYLPRVNSPLRIHQRVGQLRITSDLLQPMSPQRKIPVVDLGQLGLGWDKEASQEELQRVARQLHEAFTDIGCAYLTNHGVPDDLVSRVFNSGSAFFRLDQSQKDRYAKNVKTHEGYIASSKENFTSLVELHETYNIKSAEAVFPDAEVPSFRPSVASILKSCRKLSIRIMRVIAIALAH
nr:uncharacterized protein LOC128700464 isoform X2 [Cherax quadricarinatus]